MLERSRLEQELWELGITGARKISLGSGESGPKPILLKHYHVRKRLDTRKGKLVPDPKADVMNPLRMKAGFGGAGIGRAALQTALDTLVSNKYQSKLSPKVHLKIALVDLTEAKLYRPIFAGHGEHDCMKAASLPKILALYAAYQLRFDLNTLAQINVIKKISELKKFILKEWSNAGLVSRLAPKLDLLFQFEENVGLTVRTELWWRTPGHMRKDKSAKYLIVNPPKKWKKSEDYQIVTPSVHKSKLPDYRTIAPLINDSMFARYLIHTLGFDYIGSVALRSGLFMTQRRLGKRYAKPEGLWLNAAYLTPAKSWSKSPFPTVERHNATAMAAAKFFTLLAQGRLVNEITSNQIAEDLKKELCYGINSMLDGIKTLPGAPTMTYPNIPPNKCGLLDPYASEAIHVVRHPPAGKHPRYVAAVLTKQDPFTINFLELGKDLDALIAAQNP